jgi:hypothetical protein
MYFVQNFSDFLSNINIFFVIDESTTSQARTHMTRGHVI